MQYHFEYVDMGPFLRDLGEEYQEDARQNGMTFSSQIPQGRYIVTADRGKAEAGAGQPHLQRGEVWPPRRRHCPVCGGV